MAVVLVTLLTATVATAEVTIDWENYPIAPEPFTDVSIENNSFWGQRLEASRNVTVPLAFSKCESEGRYRNFETAAHHLQGFDTSGVRVGGYPFDDTDVYKTIEGASYLLQTYPDKGLEAYIDSVLEIVANAQEEDGYLYTARTMNPQHPHEWAGAGRWDNEEDLSHELYNLGHMVEAAIAHYQATGKRSFLDIALRYADCVCREIGPREGQTVRVPGHQIAEMALARLYVLTGEKKYLEQAKFFLDMRGKTSRNDAYSQAHLPIVEQSEAVGHAVRATYMYSGIADVAALTGDSAFINAIDRIWTNIVSRKLYITGGIGSTSNGEAFGEDYELPNMTAYCETCAAIGNVYVNFRLFLLHGESKYFDVLERSLYNGVVSGVSLDGGKFFYPNPLESAGQHQREAWFGCACCPSNICRFIPSIPGYFYQTRGSDLFVNLFGSNSSVLTVNGKRVSLTQRTNYPWDGDIEMTIGETEASQFRMLIRIPGWAQGKVVPSDLYSYCDNNQLEYSISVNGNEVTGELQDGYFGIKRTWKKGDRIEVHFDMEPRLVRAHEAIDADRGKVAVERGPLVYCAEAADNDFDLDDALIEQIPWFSVGDKTLHTEEGDYKVAEITTDTHLPNFDDGDAPSVAHHQLHLIPYYAWNHRGPGRMTVWMGRAD